MHAPTPGQARQTLTQIQTNLTHIPTPETWLGLTTNHPTNSPHHAHNPDTLPYGLDRVTDDWECGTIRTRQGCETILHEVAQEWAEKLSLPAPTPRLSCTWLANTTIRAHTHLDADTWAETCATIWDIYQTTTRLAGLDPETTPTPCPTCGTHLTRPLCEDGFTDYTLCPTCGHTYTPTTHTRATHHLAQTTTNPTIWLPTTDAARLLGIPLSRIRQWIHRGHLTTKGGLVNLLDTRTCINKK
ncbi:helix-turn-helix domain-containing protein [Actinotignum schaalii]|uniref:helix-turn-helix domain-containing protein n=1 Tax=unclassified Actinotignum TaxID=2632702 RepID=UPI003F458DA2